MIAPPRISGAALRSLARVARTHLGGLGLKRVFFADLKMGELASVAEDLCGPVPTESTPLQGRPPRLAHDAKHATPSDRAWAGTSTGFAAAYRAGRATPRQIVDRAFEAANALASRTPSVGPMLDYLIEEARREAEASLVRHRSGAPLGPLDGVPCVIKEELAVRGLPRRAGSSIADPVAQAADSTVVARLRAAGALVLGTTSMTEYGMSPVGFNPKRAMPRNPHATDRVAGGSSTGSGVAVATGLVPMAIGVDGGGSVRIPAALTGVFGLKPTWGRVSRAGVHGGGTLSHVGSIASSMLDIARMLEVIGGPDPEDPLTDYTPSLEPGSLVRSLGRGVKGLKIAIDEGEWAAASESVAKAGRHALRALEHEGAILVDTKLSLARYAAAIGYLLITLETRAAQRADWPARADDYNHDLQAMYATLEHVSAFEYLEAQRLRSGLRLELQRLFSEVDLLALPTTATTAVPVSDDDMRGGFLDSRATDSFCRFNFLANLTGLPALSAPIALDPDGLPIGFQLVGDAWDEATVIAAGAHLERTSVAMVEKPRVSVRILD
ncbi:MAG: amidase [Myxococcales bacterium]